MSSHPTSSAVLVGLAAISIAAGASACAEDEAAYDPREVFPGGETTNTLLLGVNAFTMPASNLDEVNRLAFFSGDSFFNQNWVTAPASTESRDGLGPTFNARSCSSCHVHDGRGAPPESAEDPHVALLFRLSVPGSAGSPVDDPTYGGQLQNFAVGEVPTEGRIRIEYSEVVGSYADGTTYALRRPTYTPTGLAFGPLAPGAMVSPRVAPQMVGLGLLEALDASEVRAQADPLDADGDGISGRAQLTQDPRDGSPQLGRFGWKGEQPSVLTQSAGAFLGDIGITSSIFPTNNCPPSQETCNASVDGGAPEISDSLLRKVEIYGRTLAVPMRRGADAADVLAGRALFRDAGCASCHTPSWRTGEVPDLPALANQHIWPYTDLLLHDMGEGLADGRPILEASGSEWRTPPLWGLGLVPSVNRHDNLLHDGRARGFAEAILWHGGEGEAAREAFRAMSREEREALIAFLRSL